jgi:F420 biosynthesis protein FbiB-like protein
MDGPPGHDASLLHALIRGRRSVRRYRPDAVPAALLHRLVETACWAPSAHNRQPWRFVILDKDAKASLARAMAERLTADRTADGDDPADIAADAARSVARIDGAPAALLVCLTLAEMDRYVDARRAAAERIMAIQSTAMAVQNLLLAAHAEGLGASCARRCSASSSCDRRWRCRSISSPRR